MIGVLRHRVALQSASGSADEGGGRALAWATFATVWAEIESAGGKIAWRASELEAQTPVRLRIRYRSDVSAGMRALWNGKTIELTSVFDPDGRGRTLALEGVMRE